jgi:hypothetical protein
VRSKSQSNPCSPMRRPKMAWHYTTGHCARQIVQSEVILPATEGVPWNERPAVWFSTRQDWEPTASKGIVDRKTGLRRTATIDEMEALAGGCYRFGMEATSLLRWSDLRRAAKIRPPVAKALELAGHHMGANPQDWMGRVGPVSVRDVLVIERLVNGQWISGADSRTGCITLCGGVNARAANDSSLGGSGS